MPLEYDPVTSLQHYPEAMARFGKNPHGENLYRIVLTASVRHLVGGQWPDGERGYHWVPRYRQLTAPWILEAWSMPRMSRREWESYVDPITGWPLLGPYPLRGEYNLAFKFLSAADIAGLDQIIGAIERGRQRSFSEVRQANQAEYAQEERDTKRQSEDEIRDCVSAWGNAPFSSARAMRGSKTANPFQFSAEQLGLPVPMGNLAGIQTGVRGIETRNSLSTGRI